MLNAAGKHMAIRVQDFEPNPALTEAWFRTKTPDPKQRRLCQFVNGEIIPPCACCKKKTDTPQSGRFEAFCKNQKQETSVIDGMLGVQPNISPPAHATLATRFQAGKEEGAKATPVNV